MGTYQFNKQWKPNHWNGYIYREIQQKYKMKVWIWFRGNLKMCFSLPPCANSLCKTRPVLKTPAAKPFICHTMFSSGSITPNPSHIFCSLLGVIDIHSNCHHSPLETSLIPQFLVVLRHAISCPKNNSNWCIKAGRRFVTLPLQKWLPIKSVTSSDSEQLSACSPMEVFCALDPSTICVGPKPCFVADAPVWTVKAAVFAKLEATPARVLNRTVYL